MSILQKTWSQPYNSYALPALPLGRIDLGTDLESSMLVLLKDALKTVGWKVLASSNRSVANTSDNWSSPTNVDRGLNDTWPGSWIVLKSPWIPTVYMLIDYTSVASYRLRIRWSPSMPDISSPHIYRVPEATGPEINEEVYVNGPGSGAYEWYMTVLTATDGSFILITSSIDVTDNNVLMLNFIRDADPRDPHPYVIWQKTASVPDQLKEPHTSSNDHVFSFASDGEPVECSFQYPAVLHGTTTTEIASYASDDLQRGYRPFSWPVRVVVRTAGYEGFKGFLEDVWWGAVESQTLESMRWMQPGYDGANMVVMRRGCFWFPCLEPFRW